MSPRATLTDRERWLRDVPESAWQAQAEGIARMYGWLWYHPPDNRPVRSRRTNHEYVQNVRKGFPDLVLVHPGLGLLMFAELKTETGQLTPAQREWRDAFTRVTGIRYEILRPRDGDRLAAMLDPKRLEGWNL